ncbi:MAG: glucoamylase family protein [Lentimicrobiaceae bacterium]|jgi:hypothetical protein
MKSISPVLSVLVLLLTLNWACKKDTQEAAGTIEITRCMAGDKELISSSATSDIAADADFTIQFSVAVDSNTVKNNILIKDASNVVVPDIYFGFKDNYKTVIVKTFRDLDLKQQYTLVILKTLKGSKGETFAGTSFVFSTLSGSFTLNSISLNDQNFMIPLNVYNVPVEGSTLKLEFSEPIDTTNIKSKFIVAGNAIYSVALSNSDRSIQLECTEKLQGYTKYYFIISSSLKSKVGNKYAGYSNWFTTALDSTLKFPLISDDELLTLVQRQTFKYFYDYAHPTSGMARERYSSGNTVTTGGSGFGVMALIVGMERGFITRDQGITHLTKIISFLETADRFHGAWSHWIDGSTGHVIPFGTKDDGGDLVETAFMAQGLIAMRQYLNPATPSEASLISRINTLYNGIEWDWYRRGGQNVLYWHWSPDYGWDMNFALHGYNETLITYIMAASSPTHTIPAVVYSQGYALNGGIKNGKTFYGYVLPVGYDYGGPLFFAHYSFLGLDPRNLSDAYANYWTQNVNHSLINWKYCATNPKHYPNYNASCWGLTASDLPDGYGVSEPTNDRGTIAPTAAVSSLPYTPEQSMNAIRYFYYIAGDRLWGDYGFYDAFDVSENWYASSFLAIDQGPEIVMIENYRTHLIWDLFMSAPEVQTGLTKLGFSYK